MGEGAWQAGHGFSLSDWTFLCRGVVLTCKIARRRPHHGSSRIAIVVLHSRCSREKHLLDERTDSPRTEACSGRSWRFRRGRSDSSIGVAAFQRLGTLGAW